MNRIYMDNAATTRITKPVLDAMMPYLTEIYGNPSSLHAFAQESRKAIEHARGQVATALGCQPNEVYFTGCGTESDNWAIRGAAHANKGKGMHIITSAIEHHAVLHTCARLEKEGFSVTYLPVDEQGLIAPESLERAIRPDTTLLSVMLANNEIGTIQPVAALAAIAKAHGITVHTDAVQAIGAVPVNVDELGVDMLSLSGHKFHAPKGVGALYVRRGTKLERLMEGGAQENKQRPGTENLASIVGLGAAIEIAAARVVEHGRILQPMRDRLIDGILSTIPETRLNGDRIRRLPGNVNISVRYIEGEALLLRLDNAGIAASSGSACTSGSLDPSHVLLAIGLPHEIAHGSLRFTLEEDNTPEQVEYVIHTLSEIVTTLRGMSPLYHQ